MKVNVRYIANPQLNIIYSEKALDSKGALYGWPLIIPGDNKHERGARLNPRFAVTQRGRSVPITMKRMR